MPKIFARIISQLYIAKQVIQEYFFYKKCKFKAFHIKDIFFTESHKNIINGNRLEYTNIIYI